MRGTYEAFILVEVKDGRQFVCALNRQKMDKVLADRRSEEDKQAYLEHRVIWN
jgi:hypothetical protein